MCWQGVMPVYVNRNISITLHDRGSTQQPSRSPVAAEISSLCLPARATFYQSCIWIHNYLLEKTVVVPPPLPSSGHHTTHYTPLPSWWQRCYYRPFIYNFAAKNVPLTRLLRKESTFHWGPTQENSFQEHTSVLAFPDYKDPLIMCTNTSILGLGATLMQCDEEGKDHLIAYASRALISAEANWLIHLENLVVVWGLKNFRDIISGYEITVYTDQAAVIELFKCRNLTRKLARWYLTIQEFSPKLKYIQGCPNVVADPLSRNALVGAVSNTPPVTNFSLQDLGT